MASPDLPNVRFVPLSWSQPLPASAADWLIAQAGWNGQGPLDLGAWLVVVPTRRAGRRLREALAERAAAQNQAAFAPRVVLPEALPAAVARLPRTASRAELLLAWVRVLAEARLDDFRAVVPHDPPRRDFAWCRALAMRLQRVQSELAEDGLRIADVAALRDFPETIRWRQLAALETACDAVLAAAGLSSRAAAEAAGLAVAALPPGCRQLAVVGAPDLPTIARRYLQTLAESDAKVSVIAAVAEDADWRVAFDPWGRPRPEHWNGRPLQLPDFGHQVRVLANPAEQAQRVAEVARIAPAPDEWLSVAVADPEVMAPLERELAAAGVAFFNPEGEPWRGGALHSLLAGLAALVEAPTVEAVDALLRHPDVLRYLESQYNAATVLRQWDKLRAADLPGDLAAARSRAEGSHPALHAVLVEIASWRRQLLDTPAADGAVELPARIHGRRQIAAGSVLAESARHWVESVAAAERAAVLHPGLTRAEWWQVALMIFSEGARFDPKPAEALELGGWLELLWADAPRLVLAGGNDGLLPEAVTGDAFLPVGLRELLGLKSNAQRAARDAYILAAAAAMRGAGAGVEILVGKTSAAGEPLRPSRLLLAAADKLLPERVRQLFQAAEPRQANLPWRRAWTLRPAWIAPPASISVTGLRDWLQCPFRFYLRRVLKLEPLELEKVELDAMDFGKLMHTALQAMGEDPVLRESTDPEGLRDGLLAVFDAEAERRFGKELSLPLQIQLESGRQRLRRAAVVQAGLRAEGWRIVEVERTISFPLAGLEIKGKVDRIDRHDDGRVRVIDYKTSDTPKPPLKAHVATMREVDFERPDWLRVEEAGGRGEKRWVDLQLPLYRRALAAEFGADLECAYFNLPKAVGETRVELWPEEGEALQTAAERCAEGVAAAIVAGEFWPPVEIPARDDEDWALLFHRGAAASIDPAWNAPKTEATSS